MPDELIIAEVLARRFHEHYESLSVNFADRKQTRIAWEEALALDRQLLIATCLCLIDDFDLRLTVPCQRCAGCGQIANDSDGTPWSAWLNLPLDSAVAVVAGIVRPLPCPTCNGAGRIPVEES